ncbi:MAG: hypothetical protein GX146_03605 [Myxococcales bacterium]|jgi:uncharacterized protein YegP (UPF0339 family)|nr:hypothetical protein [Myxococcales bacterium]
MDRDDSIDFGGRWIGKVYNSDGEIIKTTELYQLKQECHDVTVKLLKEIGGASFRVYVHGMDIYYDERDSDHKYLVPLCPICGGCPNAVRKKKGEPWVVTCRTEGCTHRAEGDDLLSGLIEWSEGAVLA